MVTKEQYDEAEESSSFLTNIRRNLNVVTINEYMQFVLAGFAILLLSGLIYVLSNTPQFFMSSGGGLEVVLYAVPNQGQTFNLGSIQDQLGMEMFIVAGLITIGVIGLYMMKSATSYVDSQAKAFEILLIGCFLFILAIMLLFFVYVYKFTGNIPSFVGLP